MDKKIAVKIAEAKVRVAQRKLEEAKKALKEDVNGFAFKDVFEMEWDECLKKACEHIDTIAEEDYNSDYEEMFQDSIGKEDVAAEHEDGTIEYTVACTLWISKLHNLEDYNKLRKGLGLDPIEVEKKESVASNKKNESEEKETISPAEAKVLKKAIRNTIGQTHYYKEVGQELQDTIDQLLEADAFGTEEEIEAAEKLSKAHYGSVSIKACHVDSKGVAAIKAEL